MTITPRSNIVLMQQDAVTCAPQPEGLVEATGHDAVEPGVEGDLRHGVAVSVVTHHQVRVTHVKQVHVAVARARRDQRVGGMDGDGVYLAVRGVAREYGVERGGVEGGVEGGVGLPRLEGGGHLLRGEVHHRHVACRSCHRRSLTRQVPAEQAVLVVGVARHRGDHVRLPVALRHGEERAAVYASPPATARTTLHVVALHAPAGARREQPPAAPRAGAPVVEEAPHGVRVVAQHAHPTPHHAPTRPRLLRQLVEQPVGAAAALLLRAHGTVYEERGRSRVLHAVHADGAVGLARRHGADGVHPHRGERERVLRGIDDLRGRSLDAESRGEGWGAVSLGVGRVPNTDGP